MKTMSKLIVLGLATGLMLGGCASVSKEDLAAVQATAEQAAADAAEAKAMAADAQAEAADAKSRAAAAEAKAADTESKIDRMFRKSMYK